VVDEADAITLEPDTPLEPAALVVSTAKTEPEPTETITLEPGTTLAFGLGARRCAGVLDGDVHHPCTQTAAPYCEFHTSTWVCARCTGTCLKDEMDCWDDHAVYLAAFGPDTFKVGVTKHWRLETRLREQGADRGAHIHTVSNGRIARELEADLAANTTLVDRVRTNEKRASLASQVDQTAWNALLEKFDVIRTVDFEWGFHCTHEPVAETIATGTVIGTKGRLLVLEHGGTAYAVDMRDLVGHELEGSSSQERQSSLGAFN